MNRSDIKLAAKNQLRGNWLWAIGICIIAGIFNGLISGSITWSMTRNSTLDMDKRILTSTPTQLFVGIITGLVGWGVAYTFLQFRDNKEKPNVFKGVFSAFTAEKFKNSLLTSFLSGLFMALWTLLLVIPGIIKSYSYAMAPYIMKDYFTAGRTDISATEAITASRALMDGKKWDLFVFDLSFLGWAILCIFTAGIGFIWLAPYYQQSKVNFYRQLAEDKYLETPL